MIDKKLQINEKEVIRKDWAFENTRLSSTWWQLGVEFGEGLAWGVSNDSLSKKEVPENSQTLAKEALDLTPVLFT